MRTRVKRPRAGEAIGAYKKAIELEPANAGLYFGMGWAQYYALNYPEAIAAFDKSGAMDKAYFAETRGAVGWCQYFMAVNADKASAELQKNDHLKVKLPKKVIRAMRSVDK